MSDTSNLILSICMYIFNMLIQAFLVCKQFATNHTLVFLSLSTMVVHVTLQIFLVHKSFITNLTISPELAQVSISVPRKTGLMQVSLSAITTFIARCSCSVHLKHNNNKVDQQFMIILYITIYKKTRK
jgi:hypothetical protein